MKYRSNSDDIKKNVRVEVMNNGSGAIVSLTDEYWERLQSWANDQGVTPQVALQEALDDWIDHHRQ